MAKKYGMIFFFNPYFFAIIFCHTFVQKNIYFFNVFISIIYNILNRFFLLINIFLKLILSVFEEAYIYFLLRLIFSIIKSIFNFSCKNILQESLK